MESSRFGEVATTLERSEAACRQLAARARAHVRAVRPRGTAAPPVQTAAFEIEGAVIRALYVVRNPDKLRHVAASPAPQESGRG